jgi:hypothetical protein
MSSEVSPQVNKPSRVRIETTAPVLNYTKFYEQLYSAVVLTEDGILKLRQKPVLYILLALFTQLSQLPVYSDAVTTQAKQGKELTQLFVSTQEVLKQFCEELWDTEHLHSTIGGELYNWYKKVELLVEEKGYNFLLLTEDQKANPALPGANKISFGKSKANPPFSSSH